MSTSWVAGSVRAKALARRRLGVGGARELATGTGLEDALAALARTPYRHDVRPDQDLATAQHAVGATVLWHLRVLAGWLPRGGAETVRVLAGGFELASLDEHLAGLRGAPAAPPGTPPGAPTASAPTAPPYRLGSLDTAWSRLAATTSLTQVREVLSASPWGDPGEATPWSVTVGTRLAWADRVIGAVPEAAGWARAAAALLVLRERGHRFPDGAALRVSAVLGEPFAQAALAGGEDLSGLARLLPADARWVLDAVPGRGDLWRAEARWWHRVERDGFALLRDAAFDQRLVVGAVAVLAADAWRVRAALEVAARAGGQAVASAAVPGGGLAAEVGTAADRAREAFDAVA